MHLLVDGYTSDNDLLKDANKISSLLNIVPSQISMTKISDPVVTKYVDGSKPTDWGLSGFVLIAESHISIHTFPERNYVNVDVFSCKEFDYIRSAEKIAEVFGLFEYCLTLVHRGIEYLNQPAGNTPIEMKKFYPSGRGGMGER